MDRDLYSAVRHGNLEHLNPMPSEALTALLSPVTAVQPGRALDVGCGKGAALAMLAASGWRGTGVERSPMMAKACRMLLAAHGVAERIELVEADAVEYCAAAREGSFDCAICIGSTHIFGDLERTASSLRPLVRAGGWVVLGELYWPSPPSAELLGTLGMAEDDLLDLERTLARPTSAGLRLVASATASRADFDRYEDTLDRQGREWCEAHREHPDAAAILARGEAWRAIAEPFKGEWFGFVVGLYTAEPGSTPR